jgi:hypothetical protein
MEIKSYKTPILSLTIFFCWKTKCPIIKEINLKIFLKIAQVCIRVYVLITEIID